MPEEYEFSTWKRDPLIHVDIQSFEGQYLENVALKWEKQDFRDKGACGKISE